MRLMGMALFLTLMVLTARANAQQPADGTQQPASSQDMNGTPNTNASAGQQDGRRDDGAMPDADGPNGAPVTDSTAPSATPAAGADASSAFAGTTNNPAQGTSNPPRVSDFGWELPNGFSVSAAGQVLGVYNTNITQAPQDPTSEIAAHYGGLVEVSSVSGHTYFDAVYVPGYTQFRRYNELDSLQQALALRLRSNFSKRTSYSWNLNFSKAPEWGGSAFASSNFGGLLGSLLGVTTQDLTGSVTTAYTNFNIQHTFNKHSRISFGLNGGVSKFTTPRDNPFAFYFEQPDSNTWTAGETIAYNYDLGKHRLVGVSAANSYSVFTAQNYHSNYQSANLHYQQTFSNGWGFDAGVGPGFAEVQSALIEGQVSRGRVQTTADFSVGLRKMTAWTTFTGSVGRSYQGGLVAGTLSPWHGTLAAQRIINRRWVVGLFANYTGSVYPNGTSLLNQTSTEQYSAAVQAGHRFQNRLTWFANYGYSAQRGYFVGGSGRIETQVVATGFVYDFANVFSRGMSHARVPGGGTSY